MFYRFFLVALSVMLTSLAAEDINRRTVCDAHLMAVGIWGLAGHTAGFAIDGISIWPVTLCAGTEAGLVIMTISVVCSLITMRLTGRFPLGGADIKLLSIGAFCLGFARVLIGFSMAFCLAAMYLLVKPLLGKQKKELSETIPFVPFMIAGFVIAYIEGAQIINWYTG